jgi:dynein heavy chain
LDYEGWYDLKDKEKPFKQVIGIMFVASMGHPEGGRSFLSNRFMRHFNLINYNELEDNSIKSIFERKVNFFLGKFSESVKQMIPAIVSSTLQLYIKIKDTLLPIPKTSHYLFNLRDMSKVLQGLCSASQKYTTMKEDLVRLWLHEMTRSFGDRLTNNHDRQWLKDSIDNKILEVKEFEVEKIDDIYEGVEKIIFCDFTLNTLDRPYIQVTNIKDYIKTVENKLNDYNEENKSKQMKLVMFLDACDHVARICRVIRQTGGNALLLGVGGSGRQSLAKLSAYINEMDCVQIEVNKGFKIANFRDNMKEILKTAGLKEKNIAFLLCDTQIFDELILEDMNNCLNSGDVPDIYKFDDKEDIRSACRLEVQRRGMTESWTNIFNVYLSRVKTHLHLMIAMSPVGESFNTRLRMFPSLVNCCTIDWFTEWPEEALFSVAKDSLIRNETDVGSGEEQINACVETIKFIHKSVESASEKFRDELRRYNYLTPTSFLEFLSLFQNILIKKRFENSNNINRLEMGLKVLDFAGNKVEEIEKKIQEKQPILEKLTIELDSTIKDLEIKTVESNKTRAASTIIKEEAERINKEITLIDEKCEKELTQAEQDVKASLKKIDAITENQLREIGAVQNLGEKLSNVVELLLIFKTGEMYKKNKANLIKTDDPKNPYEVKILLAGRNDLNTTDVTKFKGYFESFKDESVRDNLKNNEKHKCDLAHAFIEKKQITKEYVKQAAGSILGCFEFVVAMIEFVDKSINIVDPLRIKGAEAKVKKAQADKQLLEAETSLKKAEDEANRLEREYNEKMKSKNDLTFEITENKSKVERAKKLVGLLSSEKIRWAENVERLKAESKNLIGNCLIAAGMIAYSGAFTRDYRIKLEESWRVKLDIEKIQRSKTASLIEVMENKLESRKWNMNLLPNDNLSIENGIIMFNTRKWPLMIDPQNQASIFLKKYGLEFRDSSFQTVKITDSKMIDNVISGVKFGYWILLDNVGLSLDSALEPILLQQKQPVKNTKFFEMKIGDKHIPYNDEFKLFMITTLSNPHYSPETFARITIINFAITPDGLEDQMLSELVKIEMPDLEEKKNKILEENFQSQNILTEIEQRILDNLSKNKDNIEETLKSSTLIDILSEAKVKAEEIKLKIQESEKTREEIDSKRETYRPAALRASLLFFTLLDISYIDPMYQYSLFHFKRLFGDCVRSLPMEENRLKRIKDINKKFTKDLYDSSCRSLFEKDKLLFSFVMAVKIMMGEQNEKTRWYQKIFQNELRFFLAGPSGDLEVTYPQNPTTWISPNDWRNFYSQIYGMSKLHPDFDGIEKDFMINHWDYRGYFESNKLEARLPEPYDYRLTDFQRLILIKALRFDKITNLLSLFVERGIGKEYTEPPTFELIKSFKDSASAIPLLFVLSTGSDPKNEFQSLADLQGRKVEFVSLGKSMHNAAVNRIEDAKQRGNWVLLQNCHLAISFMPKLEDIIENLQNNIGGYDSNFRLWLTSMSTGQFSINVLKNSIKITMEPPKGLKLNLLRQYNNIKEEELEACNKPEKFKTFFFAICFFHAIVQDRRKFGPIGWNVKYDFTNEDLKVSRLQLKNFLEEYDEVPYKVLNYLGAEINYGGRVTDDKDQRLIKTILKSYLNPSVLTYENYKFSDSGIYFAPHPGSKNDYLSHIKSLPLVTSPEVFGLHNNAEIVTAQNEAFLLLETVLGMQPRTSSASGKSVDDVVKEILKIIESNTPEPFDVELVKENYKTLYEESMNTVLVQEVYRYNTLLIIMKKQIKSLKNALSGKITMSDELDKIANSLYNNGVPDIWIKKGFLSLKPLMSWVEDLKERIKFFDKWIHEGMPKAFPLSSKVFFNL